MKLTAITVDQMLNNEAKEYNVTEWTKKVNRFATFPNCQFYIVPKDEVFSYDRFYVTYKIPEGINLLASFGYSSSLTNNSVCIVFIREDGSVETSEVNAGGKWGRVANHKEGRKFMAHQSKNYDTVWTNEL